MHELKDSPLSQANCLERDKTKMRPTSCEINSELRVSVTLWLLEPQSTIESGWARMSVHHEHRGMRGGGACKWMNSRACEQFSSQGNIMNVADKAISVPHRSLRYRNDNNGHKYLGHRKMKARAAF